jgi:predicted DNA-binding transcriptional regulator AlpA
MSIATKIEGDRLLTTKEVAAMGGWNPSTLAKARVYGTGNWPPYLKIGKSVRYRLSSFLAWMESQPEHKSTSEVEKAA